MDVAITPAIFHRQQRAPAFYAIARHMAQLFRASPFIQGAPLRAICLLILPPRRLLRVATRYGLFACQRHDEITAASFLQRHVYDDTAISRRYAR